MPDSLSLLIDSLRQTIADSISQSINDSLERVQPAIESQSEAASLDWNYVFTLLGIMLVTGILGGTANFLNSPKEERNFWRSMFMGLVATIAIPLFLKVVDSNILNDTKGDILNYFIYAGCCVVAAFYSARFLEGLSSRIIQNLQEKVDRTSAAVQEQEVKINETADKTDMMLDTQIPDPAQVTPEPENVPELATEDLKSRSIFENMPVTANRSPQEKIAATFAKYPLQKIESICKVLGMSPEVVKPILSTMEQEGKLKKVLHRGEEVYALQG
ncbi:MAG: YEATS-associated helix-containing protein [Haliscomenobacter sp.]|uniref:YEATS-associated helix-containing protein n=1 Tax=Haliscomenobacter sp. TaxID=2717303 RepID=UPI0029B94198|nr:YEATS-associated helix-containing protein [Haliscomenobacter sp.]MDX2071567.1 YEATS-associated helix-containing protein [Haliscomenobacter sp.]